MKRVMIDTNIFISAVLFPKGKAAAALLKTLAPPYQPVTRPNWMPFCIIHFQ